MNSISKIKLIIKIMNNNKPKLVDYSLFEKPKPKIIPKPIHLKINKNDNSLIINFISILCLCIGSIILYYRLIERKTKDLKKQNTIISFHQYVKDNIK